MLKTILKWLLLSGVIGLIGCSSCPSGSSKTSAGINDLTAFYGEEISATQEKELLKQKVVYFGFDSFELTPEDQLVVMAHARYLLKHPNLKIRIDGHTDERGSREYNIGLGERRGNAVRKLLILKGVDSDNIIVVSYGKEKPIALGHNEEAWKLNRRADIAYEG